MVASASRGEAAESSYRSYLAGLSLSRSAITSYIFARRTWFAWCGDNAVDPLSPARRDLEQFWAAIRLAATRQTTARLRMVGVKKFLGYVDTELGCPNAGAAFHVPKFEARPVEPFTPGEIQSMLSACESALDRAILLLLVGTGLRRSEIANLNLHDINWEEGTISVLGKGLNGGKHRTVAPNPAVLEALSQYFAAPERWGVEHVGHDWVERWLRRLAVRAGLNGRVHLHRFRYTFAVEFSEDGGPIDLLQVLLGHSRIEMSLFYSKKGRERRAMAANRRFDPMQRFGLSA